ncbi:MAG TPA: class I SAM-dependent methyltransferase [Phototrophicaceae bacterium]|nr:class I SAM-dependent methyltransferase [Phototrophicaceae bacterium]
MQDDSDILNEQLNYYRARAREYDESVQQTGRFAVPEEENPPTDPIIDQEWMQIITALRRLPPGQDTLELACGTGIWTRELLAISSAVTAIDGAPEMLDVNREQLGSDPRIEYACFDLFTWQPGRQYDLVFFGFWLSHVPPDRLGDFLDKVTKATRIGGMVMLVDEPADGSRLSGPSERGLYQTRQLYDGSRYRIVKVYHSPRLIQSELERRGFSDFKLIGGQHYFALQATHSDLMI